MKTKLISRGIGFLMVLLFLSSGNLFAQFANYFADSRQHRNGKIWVMVTNFGQFGTNSTGGVFWPGTDLVGRQARYINRGALWFGGIVPSDATSGPDLNDPGDLDTLVSEGTSAWSVVDFAETFPHYPDDRSAIEVRSSLVSSPFFHPDAVSEEDFIAVYSDTFLNAAGFPFAPPKHQRALGLEIIEKSYQFSLSFAEDIVFFDLVIINIGNNRIRNAYAGFFADNDMGCIGNASQRDDATGFMQFNSTGDRVNTSWVVEPDGDDGCMPGVVGVRVLRPTAEEGQVSFNWWMSDSDISTKNDWGPITPNVYTGDPNDGEQVGTPEVDVEKYVFMSNGSFDDPQFDPETLEFNPNIPAGVDPNDNSRFLISFGPLGATEETISDPSDPMFGQTVKIFAPGDTVLFTYAIIGGEGDAAISQALGSFDPASFVDLGRNAFMAGIMFDNPGVDTDGDGYFGDDLDGDGVIDTGDGVPDFTGPPPPPSPPLKVTPGDHTITLDWSEADPSSPGYDVNDPNLPLNFKDPFVSDDPNTPEDESKDFEGFRVLRSATGILGTFEILAEYDLPDNDLGRNTGLSFTYVDHVPNGLEYTYAVVSFDRGAPSFGIEPLASSPLINGIKIAASPAAETSGDFGDQETWTEPNPYIERSGFEDFGLPNNVAVENFRVIDFVNVPAKCTIRIFTVDGDLVDTIRHDDPMSSRARWNLLSRNTRPIASGIYLYSVESDNGDQKVGRFVVIK